MSGWMSGRAIFGRWLALALRAGLAVLFMTAGLIKLGDPARFAIQIANYRLVPELASWLAVYLPPLEIVSGAALLVLPAPWRRAAAGLLAVLLGLFTVAVASALLRGVNTDCGCFGGGEDPITLLTVVRNAALLAGAVALLWLERE